MPIDFYDRKTLVALSGQYTILRKQLFDIVDRVQKGLATPEEIAVLPEIASVALNVLDSEFAAAVQLKKMN